MVGEHALEVLQVVREALFAHQGAHQRASLRAERQRITLLFKLV